MMDHTIQMMKINKDIDSFLKMISEAKCNCVYLAKGVHKDDYFKTIRQHYVPLYNDTSERLICSASSVLDIEPIRSFLVNAGTGKPSILFMYEDSTRDSIDKFNTYIKEREGSVDPRVIKSIVGNSVDFFCSLEKDSQTGEYMVCIAQISYDAERGEEIVKEMYKGEAPLIEPLSESKVRKLIRRGIDLERITPWISEDTIKNI